MKDYDYAELRDLISELEYIIGSECYNANQYRYKLTYKRNGEEKELHGKYRLNVNEATAKQEIDSMYYEFGGNHLHVGRAIVRILDFLEKRYEMDELNFQHLEDGYKMYKEME